MKMEVSLLEGSQLDIYIERERERYHNPTQMRKDKVKFTNLDPFVLINSQSNKDLKCDLGEGFVRKVNAQ